MSQTVLEEPESEVAAKRKSRFGIVGCVIAFIGLGSSVLSPWLLDLVEPAPAPAEDLADFTVKVVKSVKEKMKNGQAQVPAPAPARPNVIAWPKVLTCGVVAFGMLGLLLGTISWVKREDSRIGGAAVVAGSAAIAFQYFLLMIGVLVGLVIIAIIAALFNVG